MHLARHGKRLPLLLYYRSVCHIWFRVFQIRTWAAMNNVSSSYILRVGTTESVLCFQNIHLIRNGKHLFCLPYYRVGGHLLLHLLDIRMSSSLLRQWVWNSVSNHGRLGMKIPLSNFRLPWNIYRKRWLCVVSHISQNKHMSWVTYCSQITTPALFWISIQSIRFEIFAPVWSLCTL